MMEKNMETTIMGYIGFRAWGFLRFWSPNCVLSW